MMNKTMYNWFVANMVFVAISVLCIPLGIYAEFENYVDLYSAIKSIGMFCAMAGGVSCIVWLIKLEIKHNKGLE